MDPILSLKDVSILYPGDQTDIRAVRNVSLDVAQGEALGLVGESGSGKSSLAAAMLGLLPAGARIEGSVHFEDHEMTALAEADLRQLRGSAIASIAQDPFTALNPVLRIGSQMVAFQHWHTNLSKAERWTRACDMLEKVGLSDPETRMRQFPHQLSGCSRQRVAIGAALILLGSRKAGEAAGLEPRARIVAMAETADDPVLQLTAGFKAMERLMAKTGLQIGDFDRIEFMEAFAAVPLKFERDYGPDPDKVNVNGGHLAMGHPMGATGAILLTTLVHELAQCDGELGIVVAQAGGVQEH